VFQKYTSSYNHGFPLEGLGIEGFVAINRAGVYISLHRGSRVGPIKTIRKRREKRESVRKNIFNDLTRYLNLFLLIYLRWFRGHGGFRG
jgi:NhaP-type Na+/H+ or K+/H+ antiporter